MYEQALTQIDEKKSSPFSRYFTRVLAAALALPLCACNVEAEPYEPDFGQDPNNGMQGEDSTGDGDDTNGPDAGGGEGNGDGDGDTAGDGDGSEAGDGDAAGDGDGQPGGDGDGQGDGDGPDGPDTPSPCADLSGVYHLDSDEIELTQEGCSKVTWRREADTSGGKAWEHVYIADGVAHDTKDELGNPVRETVKIDEDGMWVDREDALGEFTYWYVYLSDASCNTLHWDGPALTRESHNDFGEIVGCEFWESAQ